MSSRKGSPGFTLIELLVVTMISAIVMAGLGSILLTAVTTQIRAMRQSRAQMAASILTKQLERDMYEMSEINLPQSGNTTYNNDLDGDIGLVWNNGAWVSPAGQSTETRVIYCLLGTDLYYYRTSYAVATLGGSFLCGTSSANTSPGWVFKIGAPDLVVKPLNITGGIFERGGAGSPRNAVHVSLQIAPSAGGMQAAPINVDLNLVAQEASYPP